MVNLFPLREYYYFDYNTCKTHWCIFLNLLGGGRFKLFSLQVEQPEPYYPAHGVGIGNRIKNLISILKITNAKTLNIHWDDKGWVSAKFSDLFIFDGINIIEDNMPNKNCKPDFFQLLGPSLFLTEEDNVQPYLKQLVYPASKQKYSIDCCYNLIPENAKKIFLPYFNMLKPSEKVNNRIKDFSFSGNFVALQVRNAPDWDYAFTNTDLNKFFDVIETYPKNTKFYLSCMNNNVEKVFKERFGEQILTLPDKDYSSMIDAVADLYIMSKAEDMIVSFHSTFAEIAYWLGGAVAKVTNIGSYQDFVDNDVLALKRPKKDNKYSDGNSFCSYPVSRNYFRNIFSVHNEYVNKRKQKVIVILGYKINLTN